MAWAMDARVLRVGKDCGVAGGLRHRTDVRRHHRAAAGHGLENGQPEGLVERRIHQDVGGTVEGGRFLERDSADEDHVLGDPQLLGEGCELIGVLASRPGPTMTSWRSPSRGRPSAHARSRPSQFLYGHNEETKRTNGFVTPYRETSRPSLAGDHRF